MPAGGRPDLLPTCEHVLLAVASIDEVTETQPRRAVPDASPRRAYLEAAPATCQPRSDFTTSQVRWPASRKNVMATTCAP
jgi:hypothetical protein